MTSQIDMEDDLPPEAPIDIHDAFRQFVETGKEVFSDLGSIAPTATPALIGLGALMTIIQSVEMAFIGYQVLVCSSESEIEDLDDAGHTWLLAHPYKNLESRIKAFKKVLPESDLPNKLYSFSHFRNWATHNMATALLPVIHNENMAAGVVPLVSAMIEYCKRVALLIHQDLERWAIERLPRYNAAFTEASRAELMNKTEDILRQAVPNLIILPPQVNKPLAEFGLWPYALKPGNDEVLLFLNDEQQLVMHVGPLPDPDDQP